MREERIIEEAARLFADEGFGASTRDLAARLGVTQALLYRYFPSKQALIDRMFEAFLARRRDTGADALLGGDRSRSLEERLTRFYQSYFGRVTPVSMRLIVRVGLDGGDLARRFSVPLTETVLRPVVAELQGEVGLPGFDAKPMMRGERELAMALHGAVMFLGVRKHVYRMPMPDDLSDLVALQVRAFLPGAREEIRRLHAEEPPDSTLAVRQLDRRRG